MLVKLLKLPVLSLMLFFVFGVLVSPNVSAYTASNLNKFAESYGAFEDDKSTMFVKFQYVMYFEQVDRDTLFEFMKEIPNDDLWCACSQTTVIVEGNGSKQIGRTWEQFYSFAGLLDHIIYTRTYLKEDQQHSWGGKGVFADIVADYRYEDLPNGGTKLTFDAIYKPNVDVVEPQIQYILGTLRESYETNFIGYFGSTGHVDLTTVEFHYL